MKYYIHHNLIENKESNNMSVAKHILEKIQLKPESSNFYSYNYRFKTIKKVANIKCNAILIVKHYAVTDICELCFIIYSSITTCQSGCHEIFRISFKDEILSLQFLEKTLSEIINILEKLVFDKLIGCLTLKEELNEGFGKKYLGDDVCCVCLEHTDTKTTCNHFICVECWQNLKKNICPICRETHIVLNDKWDSDSDEED
jgi:hypothetical protein